MSRLLVDGVFYQLNNTGIARVWSSILSRLAAEERFEIYFLDRGRAPLIEGINYIPFPTIRYSESAADSFLIQKMCDFYNIDIFSTTYYTSPVNTPMVLMLYDMIPELFDFDLTLRGWMEKDTAISFAQRYICISHNTRNDLLSFYPEIPEDKVAAAHCGVDEHVFYPRDAKAVATFRKSHNLKRPYFLFVGSRVQQNGYKNSRLVFDALAQMERVAFDVLCVGGEANIEPDILKILPPGVRCSRLELTDDELATAYAGALALVYPSLYEGFGMPVVEAMACGCPVITTRYGALAESAGSAAYQIGATSVDEMCRALEALQDDDTRLILREKGLAHARNFRWGQMAETFAAQVEKLANEARLGLYNAFFAEWKRLREIQASVDYVS